MCKTLFFVDGTDIKMELIGWKGKASLRAYVPKPDRIHYLRLIGGNTDKYEKNKFQVRREEDEKKQEEEGKENKGEQSKPEGEAGKTEAKEEEPIDEAKA